jgi:hypothetical protein
MESGFGEIHAVRFLLESCDEVGVPASNISSSGVASWLFSGAIFICEGLV